MYISELLTGWVFLYRTLDLTMVNLEMLYVGLTALKISYSWHTSVVRCVLVCKCVCGGGRGGSLVSLHVCQLLSPITMCIDCLVTFYMTEMKGINVLC